MVFIYILKLQKNKYYIGKTNYPDIRINEHLKKNCASQWTKKYKVIKVEKIIKDCDDFDEDSYTLRYMNKYGIENVRGGQFVRLNLTNIELQYIKSSMRGSNNLCFKCGSSEHFVSNCKSGYIELTESISFDNECMISSDDDEKPVLLDGYNEGYNKGKEEGIKEGYNKGYNEGKIVCCVVL